MVSSILGPDEVLAIFLILCTHHEARHRAARRPPPPPRAAINHDCHRHVDVGANLRLRIDQASAASSACCTNHSSYHCLFVFHYHYVSSVQEIDWSAACGNSICGNINIIMVHAILSIMIPSSLILHLHYMTTSMKHHPCWEIAVYFIVEYLILVTITTMKLMIIHGVVHWKGYHLCLRYLCNHHFRLKGIYFQHLLQLSALAHNMRTM
jgi:hypothetical protein